MMFAAAARRFAGATIRLGTATNSAAACLSRGAPSITAALFATTSSVAPVRAVRLEAEQGGGFPHAGGAAVLTAVALVAAASVGEAQCAPGNPPAFNNGITAWLAANGNVHCTKQNGKTQLMAIYKQSIAARNAALVAPPHPTPAYALEAPKNDQQVSCI